MVEQASTSTRQSWQSIACGPMNTTREATEEFSNEASRGSMIVKL